MHTTTTETLFHAGHPTPGGYRDVSPAATLEARGRVRLVDVREASELHAELGHIAGVDHVPLATVETAARSWDRDAEIIVICRSGARSGRAAEMLVRMGFRRVMNMAGGMLAYTAAGLPITRS